MKGVYAPCPHCRRRLVVNKNGLIPFHYKPGPREPDYFNGCPGQGEMGVAETLAASTA